MDAEPKTIIDCTRVVPNHELIQVIGQGSYGNVWLARNFYTHRLFAAKLIPLEPLKEHPRAIRELTALIHHQSKLRDHHPYLVSISNVGQSEDYFYYLMELADDVVHRNRDHSDTHHLPDTLRYRIDSGFNDPCDAYDIAIQLLKGLSFLHESGLAHRDIKPSNCVFVNSVAKLADFGLLTSSDQEASLIGTPAYMPPDRKMGPSADTYAMGLVIYELLTGLPPGEFPRWPVDRIEWLKKPKIKEMNRIVLKSCSSDRYSNAGEMLDDMTQQSSYAKRRLGFHHHVLTAVFITLVTAIGCYFAIANAPPNTVSIDFVTQPFEAKILLDDQLLLRDNGTPYRTPCTVRALPSGKHHITFQHPDMPDLEMGIIDLSNVIEVNGRWPE